MSFDETTPVNPLAAQPLDLPLADFLALGALEQRKASFARRVLGFVSQVHGRSDDTHKAGGDMLRYPTKRVTSDGKYEPMPDAFLEMAATADGLGFRYVGTVREGVTPEGIHSDVFIAKDDTAFLLHSQRPSSDPLLRSRARYCIYSFFDDGTALETHASASESLKPSPFIAASVGTGVLANDWPIHRANAAALAASKRCRALRVQDHAGVVRLLRFYAGHLIAEEHARVLFLFVGVLCAIIAVGLFILERLL